MNRLGTENPCRINQRKEGGAARKKSGRIEASLY